jgi:hypothetical protein
MYISKLTLVSGIWLDKVGPMSVKYSLNRFDMLELSMTT